LYLLTTVNLKLRPKILRELQPGSRVVSTQFAMDNWKADAHTESQGRGRHARRLPSGFPAKRQRTWTWVGGARNGRARAENSGWT